MGKADHLEQIIRRLLTSHDDEEIKEIYAEWSETYDEDLANYGYIAPQIGAELYHQAAANPTGLIFDAGCGTGLVGQELAKLGYSNIHGGDFSVDMLAVARTTGRYRQLIEIDLQRPLHLPDNSYDGIISIGVYSSPLKQHFLPELIRIAKPNAVLCLSCRYKYFDDDLHPQIETHEQAGTITTLSITQKPYITGQDSTAAYILLQKL